MVFVVIFSMVSFVIGSYGIQIIVNLFGAGNQLVGVYDGQKIKSRDFLAAQNELQVLQQYLMADRMLMGQNSGLAGPLLADLIFRDSQMTGDLASGLKQAVQQGQLQVSLDTLEKYFSQKQERPEVLWILLKAEAYRTGFLIPSESARGTLEQVIPQISQMAGAQMDYASYMGQIVRATKMSEQQILRTFADLMSVLSYAGNVMNNQAVTINQVRADVARTQERLDVDFVKFSASDFVDPNTQVVDADLQKQFDAYKEFAPNSFSPSNPFGFGYKLPKRVQIEYLVLPMDEVKKQIEKPTAEAVEDYYSQNIQRFRSETPSDPNNPDSEKITKTEPFAEVESSIRRNLEEEKTTTLANQILIEARGLTEKGFESLNLEQAKAADLQMAAGDYEAAAKQLSDKFKVPVYSGKTGLVGPQQFADDPVLRSLMMQQRQGYLRLAELAFAVTEEKPERPLIGLPTVRVWENIGPLSGSYSSGTKYTRVMAMVRVVEVEPAQVPQNLDVTFDAKGMTLPGLETADKVFSLKEEVKQDLLLARSMDIAKGRAEELAQLAKDQDWDKAVQAYNDKYAKMNARQTIRVDSLKQQQQMAPSYIAMLQRFMQDNPSAAGYMQTQLANGLLTNRLYKLLPSDAETTGTIQAVVAFEPQAACYTVKEIVRQPATVADYLENKAMAALQLSASDTAALALTHFSTENILQRMKYASKLETEEEVRAEEEMLPSGEIL